MTSGSEERHQMIRICKEISYFSNYNGSLGLTLLCTRHVFNRCWLVHVPNEWYPRTSDTPRSWSCWINPRGKCAPAERGLCSFWNKRNITLFWCLFVRYASYASISVNEYHIDLLLSKDWIICAHIASVYFQMFSSMSADRSHDRSHVRCTRM